LQSLHLNAILEAFGRGGQAATIQKGIFCDAAVAVPCLFLANRFHWRRTSSEGLAKSRCLGEAPRFF